MADLLAMVNRMREHLRSADALTSLPTSDFETDTHVAMINGAAHDVLEGQDWSFDAVDDGVAFFYAPYTGTNLDTTFTGQVTGEVQIDQTTASTIPVNVTGTNISANGGSAGSPTGTVSRLVIEEDTKFPNFSYRVVNIDDDASSDLYDLMLEPFNRGDAFAAGGGNWTLYSNQAVVPQTAVRSLLEIRNEETPLSLEFINHIHELRKFVPRDQLMISRPELVVFGGHVASTTTASATPVTGHALTVWPVPESDTMLRYSYMRNHAELSSGSDTYAGLPDRMFDIIVWRAVQLAFSTIQRNSQQAQAAGAIFSQKLGAAIEADEKMPGRHRNMRTWDAGRSGGVKSRWGTSQVPLPS